MKTAFNFNIRMGFATSICILLFVQTIAQSNIPTSVGAVPAPAGNVMPNLPSSYNWSLNHSARIYTWTPRTPTLDENQVITATDPQSVSFIAQHFDGLGRTVQTVARQSSPTQTDIIAPVFYDEFGREQFKYLPFNSQNSSGKPSDDPFTDQANFYTNNYLSEQPALTGEQFFYSHIKFEQSPLNRPIQIFAPGNSWAGSEGGDNEKSTLTYYMNNSDDDPVQIWNIGLDALTYSNNDQLTNIPFTNDDAVYDLGSLYWNVVFDENFHATVEYKNKDGLVVLKRIQIGKNFDLSDPTAFLSTYYIYDDLNRLRFVIPPKATAILQNNGWQFSSTLINELCFRYEYDKLGRTIAKKVPGSGWVYSIYDKRDRIVFTQDANMRLSSNWQYILYDNLNRAVQSGIMTYNSSPSDLQDYVDENTGNYSSSTTTDNVTYQGGMPSDLSVNIRVLGTTTYSATSSIEINPEFTSEDGAEFETDIVNGNNGGSTIQTTIVINDNPIPTDANPIPLIYNFYDDYSQTSKSYSTANINKLNAGGNTNADDMPSSSSALLTGMPTVKRVRVIENPADLTIGNWLESATFYDDKGRAIQTINDNYKGGQETATSLYSFTNKTLSTYQTHNNPAASISLTTLTNVLYDHVDRVLQVSTQINDDPATQRTIVQNTYDALGQLKEKQLGQQVVSGDGVSGNPIEDDNYNYNIRGWLKGVNWQNYGSDGSTTPNVNAQNNKWFGMDLSYDWGFDATQVNGNISGQRWVSANDNAERSYGYGYDNANRLLFADFNQNFSGSWSKNDPGNANFNIDFSVLMGDGQNYLNAYDENGNILAMKQKGLVVNSSPQIDDLTYSYNENSNKLQRVSDIGVQSLTMNLGDFHDRNTDGDDYGYDVNGNMITDKNKAINGNTGVDQQNGAIIYNHLNLPYQVKMQNDDGSDKGTITYIYDASGNKLEKRVNEFAGAFNNNTAAATNTTYLGGAVYQNNVLQFLAHEEGRIRPIQATDYNNNQVFAYDYFVKDHLGNTRVVLTDELQQDVYPAATLEDGGNSVESAYYNINVGNIVNTPDEIQGWYANNNELPPNPDPNIDVNASSTKMYRLNGASGDKVGLGIALKVMTGDNVTIFGKSFWTNAGTPIDNNNYNIVASSLLSLFAGTSAVSSVEGGNASSILNSQITPDELTTLLQNNEPAVTNKPKAFVNWILFDEQFQPVASSSGFDPVDDNPDEAYEHINSVNISQSGYLYVYCSNESNVDVLFDNLQVVHTKGALLETTHYYPFGLTMGGISDNAIKSNYSVNKYRYNGKELQHQEFSDGSGLEAYDYGARLQDPQLGVWHNIDPLADKLKNIMYSPYSYAIDDPVLVIDPNGKDWNYSLREQDGKTHIDLTFKATIVNNSDHNYSKKELRALKNQFTSQLEKAFSKDFGDVQFSMKADIRVSKNDKDIKQDEHVYRITDGSIKATDRNEPYQIGQAVSEFGGKEMFIKNDKIQDIISGKDQNTISHETGHTAWLVHPDANYSEDPRNQISSDWQQQTGQIFNDPNNLMNVFPANTATNLLRQQFMAIVKAINGGSAVSVNRATVDNTLDNSYR